MSPSKGKVLMSDNEDPDYCPPGAPDTAAADEAIVVNLPDTTGRDATSKAPRRSTSARSSVRARPETDVAALPDRLQDRIAGLEKEKAMLEEEKTMLEEEKKKADELRELYNNLLKASEKMRDAFSYLSCPLLREIPVDPVVMDNHGEQVFSGDSLRGCIDGRNPVNRQPLGTPNSASFVLGLAYEAADFVQEVDKQSDHSSIDMFVSIREHKRYNALKDKFDRSWDALTMQEYDEFHFLANDYGQPALVEKIEAFKRVIPYIRRVSGCEYIDVYDSVELACCYKVVGEKEKALQLLYSHAKSEPQAFKSLYSDPDISVTERTTLLASYSGPHTWFYCKAMMTFIARDVRPGSHITPALEYARNAAIFWGEKLTDDNPVHDTDHNMDQEAFDLLRRLKGEPPLVQVVSDDEDGAPVSPSYSATSPSYAPHDPEYTPPEPNWQ